MKIKSLNLLFLPFPFFTIRICPLLRKLKWTVTKMYLKKMEDQARNDHDNEFEMYQVRLTIQEFKYKNRYETKIILVNLWKMLTLRPKPGGWNKNCSNGGMEASLKSKNISLNSILILKNLCYHNARYTVTSM